MPTALLSRFFKRLVSGRPASEGEVEAEPADDVNALLGHLAHFPWRCLTASGSAPPGGRCNAPAIRPGLTIMYASARPSSTMYGNWRPAKSPRSFWVAYGA